MRKSALEPELTSPVPLGPSSNGEVPPEHRTRRHDEAEDLYRRIVEEKSRRLGMTRRQFIDSSCGTLAAAWVLNQVSGCGNGTSSGKPGSSGGTGGQPAAGGTGGGGGGITRDAGYDVERDVSADQAGMVNQEAGYDVPKDALEDQAQADAMISGDEFIFDVQVHNTVPKPPWNDAICASKNPQVCPIEFLREIFVASDTLVACLSGYPNYLPAIEARDGLKKLIDMVEGSPRLLIHANVRPQLGPTELDAAQMNAKTYPVAAWKVYPDGGRLNEQGEFFRRAREVGVKIVAAHRGLGGGPGYDDSYSPKDVVAAAKANPDFTFLVYHAGIDRSVREDKPYNEASPSGIDRLIKAMKEFQVGPQGNVYAELGSTWNFVMRDPVQATHTLGKLLLHLGPDRILWGTDSLNDGNPKAQIEMFRLFKMNAAVQATYNYPDLTPEVKRKILGLNAARVYNVDPNVVRRKVRDDDLSKLKLARRIDPDAVPLSPHRFHGPRTWREYLGFRRWSGEEV